MIKIDGSYLEGGGQIVRTSLSLSGLTGKGFEISSIRKNRPKPGLREQHLQAVEAVGKICNAKHNAELNSETLKFEPEEINGGSYLVKVRTAGSTALILNTIMPLAHSKKIKVKITGGGTWNKFAPPMLSIKKVLLVLLKKFNYKGDVKIIREGFYPKGGAEVDFAGEIKKIKKIDLNQPEELREIEIISVASKHLKNKRVAERQAKRAEEILNSSGEFKENIRKRTEYVDALCPGSGILIVGRGSRNIISADSLGERGKSAEKVGKEVAKEFLSEIKNKSSVDKHIADQLMVYMALAVLDMSKKEHVESEIKTSEITLHAKTNAYVIEKFLPVEFEFKDKTIKCRKKKS